MPRIPVAILTGVIGIMSCWFGSKPLGAQQVIFPPSRDRGQPITQGAGTRAIPRPPDVPEFPNWTSDDVDPSNIIEFQREYELSDEIPQSQVRRRDTDMSQVGVYNATDQPMLFVINNYLFTLEPASYKIFQGWLADQVIYFASSYENGTPIKQYELDNKQWYFFDEVADSGDIELYQEQPETQSSRPDALFRNDD